MARKLQFCLECRWQSHSMRRLCIGKWLVDTLDINGASGETVSDFFVSVDIASSNLGLRKHLMKTFAGCICQLMSIDFLDFVATDNPTRIVYNVNGIGKIKSGIESVWLFPNVKMSNTSDFDVIFSDTSLKHRSIPALPTPQINLKYVPKKICTIFYHTLAGPFARYIQILTCMLCIC